MNYVDFLLYGFCFLKNSLLRVGTTFISTKKLRKYQQQLHTCFNYSVVMASCHLSNKPKRASSISSTQNTVLNRPPFEILKEYTIHSSPLK